MPTENIVIYKKHILLDRSEVILIDTGSPASFHINGIINFGEKNFQCPTKILGVDCDYLSRQLERPIAGLLGMDILGQFDNVVFDYANNQISLNCDVDIQNVISLNSGIIMTVPYIELNIDGNPSRMFLDTGAPISYISQSFTIGKDNLGIVEDFHPEIGTFTTGIYSLPVSVAGNTIDMIFGNLPSLMQQALRMTGIDGIIGYDLFSRTKMMLSKGKMMLIR